MCVCVDIVEYEAIAHIYEINMYISGHDGSGTVNFDWMGIGSAGLQSTVLDHGFCLAIIILVLRINKPKCIYFICY